MKHLISGCCFMLLISITETKAQNDTVVHTTSYRIGIFAPLYLDSVFNNNTFRYRQGIPKLIMPALDFVQGAQIALDSLPAGSENIEAFIFDTKAYFQNVPWLIQNNKLDSLQLIIGSVKDEEYLQLANFALQKKIPFVSATLPHDGGIYANPYLVILNSTLKAHCDAIYAFLLQNHGTDKIFLCRKTGVQEDKVAAFFKEANEKDGKKLLDLHTLNFDNTVYPDLLKTKIDSNRKNIIIGCSLDESFTGKLAAACFKFSTNFPITLIGMPNWDGMQVLRKKDALKDFPVYYTSPFDNSKVSDYSKMVINGYAKKYRGRANDMAFKGFESVLLFTQLLKKHPTDLIENLNDKSVSVSGDYNFKPVILKAENLTPDYYENKHLYFIKIVNGITSRAW